MWLPFDEVTTGKQREDMRGYFSGGDGMRYGTVAFSGDRVPIYSGSTIERYVNDYKTILEEDYGVDVVEARLITEGELTDQNTFACVAYFGCSDTYPWIYSTSYWTGSASFSTRVYFVRSNNGFSSDDCSYPYNFGVRPVIVISKDLI